MAVLLTGGAGFIGSHTAVQMLNAGEKLVIMDNFSNSKPEVLESIRKITGRDFVFYQADMLDSDALEKIFSENEIEAVIHFAGFKAVGESVEKPVEYYYNNITGTLKILQAMKAHSCKKFVFSSSATVYGSHNPVPFVENMPTDATNPYGQTKIMIEQILTDVCHADKSFCAMLLRYFNPIGAHESGLIGEVPQGIPNNLMPYIMDVATGKRPFVKVYGNDYPTPDGTGVRDYIHVVDLADGHLAALKYARGSDGCCAVNLGTGHGYSVLEVVAAVEKATGRKIKTEIYPRRAGDIAECYADVTKAKALLGWEAKRGIEEMCVDSVRAARQRVES